MGPNSTQASTRTPTALILALAQAQGQAQGQAQAQAQAQAHLFAYCHIDIDRSVALCLRLCLFDFGFRAVCHFLVIIALQIPVYNIHYTLYTTQTESMASVQNASAKNTNESPSHRNVCTKRRRIRINHNITNYNSYWVVSDRHQPMRWHCTCACILWDVSSAILDPRYHAGFEMHNDVHSN